MLWKIFFVRTSSKLSGGCEVKCITPQIPLTLSSRFREYLQSQEQMKQLLSSAREIFTIPTKIRIYNNLILSKIATENKSFNCWRFKKIDCSRFIGKHMRNVHYYAYLMKQKFTDMQQLKIILPGKQIFSELEKFLCSKNYAHHKIEKHRDKDTSFCHYKKHFHDFSSIPWDINRENVKLQTKRITYHIFLLEFD